MGEGGKSSLRFLDEGVVRCVIARISINYCNPAIVQILFNSEKTGLILLLMQELPVISSVDINQETRVKKPSWLRVKLPMGENYRHVRGLVDDQVVIRDWRNGMWRYRVEDAAYFTLMADYIREAKP